MKAESHLASWTQEWRLRRNYTGAPETVVKIRVDRDGAEMTVTTERVIFMIWRIEDYGLHNPGAVTRWMNKTGCVAAQWVGESRFETIQRLAERAWYAWRDDAMRQARLGAPCPPGMEKAA